MSDSGKAVFLSYASQDAEAAKKICDALRAAGLEVWFDQSELRGGDQWDQQIRRQIKDCALFVPLITAHTNARPEGYFRLEWKLAVDRSHLLADDHPFLFPVVIGDFSDATARVPDKFREVQWTRLSVKDTPETLAVRVGKLLGGDGPSSFAKASEDKEVREDRGRRRERPSWVRNLSVVGGLAIGLIYAIRPLLLPEKSSEPRPAVVPEAPAKPAIVASETDQLVARADALCRQLNYSRDNLAAAEDLLRKATDLSSDSAQAWGARAYVQSNYILRGWDTSDKRREDTQTFARRALALDPNEAEAMLALAILLNQQRAFAQAETLARSGLDLRPDDLRLRSALIVAVTGQGRGAEAFSLAEDTMRRFPREPLSHYGLANGYRQRGQFEEALASFDAALALQPFAGALLYKAILLVTWRGDVPAARATLDKIAPGDRGEDRAAGVAMWLGLVERKPARVHEAAALTARAYFEDSVTPGPKAWSVALAHQLDGKETLAHQQWQAAEEVLRQRLRDHPDATDDRARLATTLVRLGRGDEAAREIAPFEAGAKEQPSSRSAYLLAQYYAAQGNAAQAAPQLARAMNQQVFVTPNALRLDPQWDKLRGQPEFEALLAETKKEAAAPAPVSDKSVAVLAFANLSDEKANEYFSDGISEELLNVLAKIPGLKVSARTSAFYFKGKEVPIPEIAKQLGVAYVVEGSVRKMGNQVRITAQLIKASDGFHVWSENFTRDLKDIFAVQDEIAGLIAQNLSLRLGASAAAPMVNSEAFELYLQGRQAWNLRSPEGYERAEALFTRAIELDPRFARAYAGRADVWMTRAVDESTAGLFEQRESPIIVKVGAEIARALEIDPSLAEGHAALGSLQTQQWKFAEGIRSLEHAIALNSNYATAHQRLGRALMADGRLPEALTALQRAHELDPLSSRICDNYALALITAQRPAEALVMVERALALQPNSLQALGLKAGALAELKRPAEAKAMAQRYLELSPRVHSGLIAYALARSGAWQEAISVLQESDDRSSMEWRAAAFLAMGRVDEGLAQLASGMIKPLTFETLFFWPVFDPVRYDPRFLKLLETFGLTEAHARAQAWRAANPPKETAIK